MSALGDEGADFAASDSTRIATPTCFRYLRPRPPQPERGEAGDLIEFLLFGGQTSASGYSTERPGHLPYLAFHSWGSYIHTDDTGGRCYDHLAVITPELAAECLTRTRPITRLCAAAVRAHAASPPAGEYERSWERVRGSGGHSGPDPALGGKRDSAVTASLSDFSAPAARPRKLLHPTALPIRPIHIKFKRDDPPPPRPAPARRVPRGYSAASYRSADAVVYGLTLALFAAREAWLPDELMRLQFAVIALPLAVFLFVPPEAFHYILARGEMVDEELPDSPGVGRCAGSDSGLLAPGVQEGGEEAEAEAEAAQGRGEKREVEAAQERGEKREAEAAQERGEKKVAEVARERGEKREAEVAQERGEKKVAEVARERGEKREAEAAQGRGEKREAEAAQERGEKREAEAAQERERSGKGETAGKEGEEEGRGREQGQNAAEQAAGGGGGRRGG